MRIHRCGNGSTAAGIAAVIASVSVLMSCPAAAFRWTLADGISRLDGIAGSSLCTGERRVRRRGGDCRHLPMVGASSDRLGAAGEVAFVWDLEQGTLTVAMALRGQAPNGQPVNGMRRWTLVRATAISVDGLVIVGSGTNPDGQTEGWVARLPH